MATYAEVGNLSHHFVYAFLMRPNHSIRNNKLSRNRDRRRKRRYDYTRHMSGLDTYRRACKCKRIVDVCLCDDERSFASKSHGTAQLSIHSLWVYYNYQSSITSSYLFSFWQLAFESKGAKAASALALRSACRYARFQIRFSENNITVTWSGDHV